jgi:hypothetical protein
MSAQALKADVLFANRRLWNVVSFKSAYPPKADLDRNAVHVRYVPMNETARAVGAAAWGAGVPAMDGRWERVA